MKVFHFVIFFFLLAFGAQDNTDIVNKLKQNLNRLDKSILITKEKVKSPKEVEFLPDIYFALAELYIEKARYMYALKLELKSGTPPDEIDFTAEKRVKQEAIETLQSLLERYVKYSYRDKVLFAIAHEYREINDNNKAMKYYKEIIEKYPNSNFWGESQFLLGLIFFEKKDFEFAKQQFEKVLERKESSFEAQAHYKIGQCEIFMGKYLDSLMSFEKALLVAMKSKDSRSNQVKDVREEALVASVVPLSDLTDQELSSYPRFLNLIDYYRDLSYDKASFRRVLQRLGRRLTIKARHYEAAKVYYELMRLSSDPQSRIDAFEAYYLAMKQSKKDYFPESIQKDLLETFNFVKLDGLRYFKYEPAYRDIATKFHINSNAANRIEDFKTAVVLYEDYLYFFQKTKFSDDMKVNLAESYFKSERFIDSAVQYEHIAKMTKDKLKAKDFYLSALQSLEKSFLSSNELSVLERFQSRVKYREVASEFLRINKDRQEQIRISFNVAKTYYDEKRFEEAVTAFRQFVTNYPNEAQSTEGALLLLDTYYIRDDLKGLVNEGNNLLVKVSFSPQIKAKIREILQQSQLKNVKSLAGDFGSKKYAESIIQFAKSNKNSTLGESALFEAFTALKAQNDEKTFEVGEDYLASFPKGSKSKEVLLAMTQMALASIDLKRAQRFLTAYTQKFPDDENSKNYLYQAAVMAEQNGDWIEAAKLYRELGDIEKQAQVLLQDLNWGELQSVASRISGAKGIYYSGLGMYRQGKKQEGLNLLRRLQNISTSDFETKAQVAHAGYILAYEDTLVFKTIGVGASFTPMVLKQKIQNFQEVDKQIQAVIKQGIGKWALAALYLEGMLNMEMVRYLSSVSVPPGMDAAQMKKILDPQIRKFQLTAQNLFSQCLVTAEENDIFTSFVDGCRSKGTINISEERDLQKKIRELSRSLASVNYSQIRKQIYKEPRNPKVIRPLVKSYVLQGNYASALATLIRLQEIEPQNQDWKAEMGVVSLYMNNLDDAFRYFQEAYEKDTHNKTAVWGLKSLYRKFNYTRKSLQFVAKMRSVGKPDGLLHPWMTD